MQGRDRESDAVADPAKESLRLHRLYKGKVQIAPKCPIRGLRDFTYWYTPGVAAPCLEIAADPAAVLAYTNKGNSIAIVSDGTRVLGLGDIGPTAALPVMEGKALLFKYLGGVDAVPLCLDAKQPDEFIRIVRALAPSFGGINLEDIAQPKCFKILAELRASMPIPVWHDDQQGSATAMLAALMNALQVVGKDLHRIKIAMIGMGAANVAIHHLLRARGVAGAQIVACDSRGTLHRQRADVEAQRERFPDKWRICTETNPDCAQGGIAEALRGADVCVAFSRPGPELIQPQQVRAMARDAIVFACANPVPEIWPWDAEAAGARIVASGRSDLPNQVNNSLAFPGIFRGALDVRARSLSDGMALAAAEALAGVAREAGLQEDRVLPHMGELAAHLAVAVATGLAAQQEGLAELALPREALAAGARKRIQQARELSALLQREKLIPPPPGEAP